MTIKSRATLFAMLSLPILLSACAGHWPYGGTPTALYYRDGQAAHLANCSRDGWSDCLMQAGALCTTAGYDVLEKHTAIRSEDMNGLIFVCRHDTGTGSTPTEAPQASN